MRTPEDEQFDDIKMNESDDYLIKLTKELELELSDIKVSDELIAKTLAKVNEQTKNGAQKPASNVISMESMKTSAKNKARNFEWIKPVSVAVAACFVLVLGANVLKSGLIGGRKDDSSSKSLTYDMEVTDQAKNATSSLHEESMAPVNEDTVDVKVEEAETAKEGNGQSSAPLLGYGDQKETDFTADSGGDDQALDTTVLQNKAYDKALESIPSNASKVYKFLDSSYSDQAMLLLSLFTSKELNVSAAEPADEWDYYLVFSLGEEDAVTYQVGKKSVLATIYHQEEEPSQIFYEMKDADNFITVMLEYLN